MWKGEKYVNEKDVNEEESVSDGEYEWGCVRRDLENRWCCSAGSDVENHFGSMKETDVNEKDGEGDMIGEYERGRLDENRPC